MNIDTVRKAIGDIDADLIEAADAEPEAATEKAIRPWMKWAAAAAAFIVVVAGAFIALNATGVIGTVAENNPNLGRPSSNSGMSELVSSGENEENEHAREAYDYFLSSVLRHDEYGEPVYPEDYAGQYTDGENFVLRLTDTSDENISVYREKIGKKYADCLKFEKADYSYSYMWSKANDATLYIVGKSLVRYCMSKVPQRGDRVDVTVITYDFTEEELKEELEREFAVPFSVLIDLYYFGDNPTVYAGTADIIEGFDPHVADGIDGDTMYVIRNGEKYKLNVITRRQALEKYGDYSVFQTESQSAIIHPSGAVESVQALYNDETEVNTGRGEFVKRKNEIAEYTIDGKQMRFEYFKSGTVKRYADSSLDGLERSYVIDYYKTDDDCVISRYEGEERILSFSTANVLKGKRKTSKDDAVATAHRAAVNSDFGVNGTDEASVEVRESVCYNVVMVSKYGRFSANVNYYGELLSMRWDEDAALALTPWRIAAAKAKMDAAIEKWKQERPGSRYEVQSVSFERIGEDIEAVFEVLKYTDPDSNACGGYTYYCLA